MNQSSLRCGIITEWSVSGGILQRQALDLTVKRAQSKYRTVVDQICTWHKAARKANSAKDKAVKHY